MSPSVKVRSIQALIDLRTSLSLFAADARGPIHRQKQDIRHTLTWLDERRRHWETEARVRREQLKHANTELERCRASGRINPNSGRRQEPNCERYQLAVRRATERVREADAELQRVKQALRHVEEARIAFVKQAQRLEGFLDVELVKAQEGLERRIAALEAYTRSSSRVGSYGSGVSSAVAAMRARSAHSGHSSQRADLPTLASKAIQRHSGKLKHLLGASNESALETAASSVSGWESLQSAKIDKAWGGVYVAQNHPIVAAEYRALFERSLYRAPIGSGETNSTIAADSSTHTTTSSRHSSHHGSTHDEIAAGNMGDHHDGTGQDAVWDASTPSDQQYGQQSRPSNTDQDSAPNRIGSSPDSNPSDTESDSGSIGQQESAKSNTGPRGVNLSEYFSTVEDAELRTERLSDSSNEGALSTRSQLADEQPSLSESHASLIDELIHGAQGPATSDGFSNNIITGTDTDLSGEKWLPEPDDQDFIARNSELPLGAEVASLIHELGPDLDPQVVIVLEVDDGVISLFQRASSEEPWRLIHSEEALAEYIDHGTPNSDPFEG